MNEWINLNGNWFSFLGLAISILTFMVAVWNRRGIEKLNKKNLKRTRMPQINSDLKTSYNSVTNLRAAFEDNRQEIKMEFSKISPLLSSLQKSLYSSEMKNVYKLEKSMSQLDNWMTEENNSGITTWLKIKIGLKQQLNESHVERVMINLNRLITEVDNIEKDLKYE
ncbi:MAG: hypothetical protein RIF33_18520 [Cyclobacteriaceae bacterium]